MASLACLWNLMAEMCPLCSGQLFMGPANSRPTSILNMPEIHSGECSIAHITQLLYKAGAFSFSIESINCSPSCETVTTEYIWELAGYPASLGFPIIHTLCIIKLCE